MESSVPLDSMPILGFTTRGMMMSVKLTHMGAFFFGGYKQENYAYKTQSAYLYLSYVDFYEKSNTYID